MNYYTHAGRMHTDEIGGYVILKLAGICDNAIRVEDIKKLPEIIAKEGKGVVGDINRIYNRENDEFDHHQKFIKRENGYPLATMGLIWEKYGIQAIKAVHEESLFAHNEDDLNFIKNRVDQKFIYGLDAHDSDNDYFVSASCSAGEVQIMTLPNLLASMNNHDVKDHFAQMDIFLSSAKLIEILLIKHINEATDFLNIWRERKAIFEILDNVAILRGRVPASVWKEIILKEYPGVDFVIYKSDHIAAKYNLQCVPVSVNSRTVKRPLDNRGNFKEKDFIHAGKWLAGHDNIQELMNLAQNNTLIKAGHESDKET